MEGGVDERERWTEGWMRGGGRERWMRERWMRGRGGGRGG